MLRFKIKELIDERNEQLPREEWLTIAKVAEAIGVGRSTLAALTSFVGQPVTNTAHLEALCRFFNVGPEELLEFDPPLDQPGVPRHVDLLYPERAERRRRRGGTQEE